MTKKKHIVRSDEVKFTICRAVIKEVSQGGSLNGAAAKAGVAESVVRGWLKRHGAELGWTGSVTTIAKARSRHRLPIGARPPDSAWLAKNQAQLGLALPAGQEPEEEREGDTLLSRPEPPASEMEGAIVVRPRRGRAPVEREQREPLYAEPEPVQCEAPPSPPPSSAPLIESELLKQALREKDAVLTTLEILIREGRIKIPH